MDLIYAARYACLPGMILLWTMHDISHFECERPFLLLSPSTTVTEGVFLRYRSYVLRLSRWGLVQMPRPRTYAFWFTG